MRWAIESRGKTTRRISNPQRESGTEDLNERERPETRAKNAPPKLGLNLTEAVSKVAYRRNPRRKRRSMMNPKTWETITGFTANVKAAVERLNKRLYGRIRG